MFFWQLINQTLPNDNDFRTKVHFFFLFFCLGEVLREWDELYTKDFLFSYCYYNKKEVNFEGLKKENDY